MSARVRPLLAEGRPVWMDLWCGYLEFYESPLPLTQRELTWQRLLDPGFGLHGFGAEQDGRLVGFAHCLLHPSTWTEGDYCYLQDLFVAPAVRRSGTGKALIDAVEAFAQSRDAQRVYWLTQEGNTAGRTLYDRVATRTGFIHYKTAVRKP